MPYPDGLITGKVNFAFVRLLVPLRSEVGNSSEVRFRILRLRLVLLKECDGARDSI